MSVRVVIARYAEPLEWVRMLPRDWEVFIYNKGPRISDCFGAKILERPNVGREAETFCFHNATVTPSDYTIYLQGKPLDHYIGIVEIAQAVMERKDKVGWLGYHFSTSWNGPPHTTECLGLRGVWERLCLSGPCPPVLSFPAGAQMVVSGDAVAGRSDEWWSRAAAVATSEDWRVAHCIERLWPTIYSRTRPAV